MTEQKRRKILMKETVTMVEMIHEFNEMKKKYIKETVPVYIISGQEKYAINRIRFTIDNGILLSVGAIQPYVEEIESPLPDSRCKCHWIPKEE